MKKIYISHSSKYNYKDEIYNPIKESQIFITNKFFFPHDDSTKIINTKQIIANCDLVIAEVSLAATGQGIELGWADCLNIPIICFFKKGSTLSSSLKYISTDFIEYTNTEDMIDKMEYYIKKYN